MENNPWIKMDDKEPELGKLVMTWSLFRSFQLRTLEASGLWYDEYGDLDDSEPDFELWAPIPTLPSDA